MVIYGFLGICQILSENIPEYVIFMFLPIFTYMTLIWGTLINYESF